MSTALEFAEYMASAAERFIEAAMAMVDEYHDADDKGRDPNIDALAETYDDCLRGLRSGIYEFRKRAIAKAAREGA